MSNDTSVFPVTLLENAVTIRLHIKAKKYAVHLSDESTRCPFPMNCLCSTCRLTNSGRFVGKPYLTGLWKGSPSSGSHFDHFLQADWWILIPRKLGPIASGSATTQ